jgi:hypothetical protein
MRIYFGKISKEYNIDQIEHGYYSAARGSTWFNGIDLEDYAFVIGGDRIQLWKAREWKRENDADRLEFEILIPNLGISVRELVEFKYFKLTSNLIVKTTRSVNK